MCWAVKSIQDTACRFLCLGWWAWKGFHPAKERQRHGVARDRRPRKAGEGSRPRRPHSEGPKAEAAGNERGDVRGHQSPPGDCVGGTREADPGRERKGVRVRGEPSANGARTGDESAPQRDEGGFPMPRRGTMRRESKAPGDPQGAGRRQAGGAVFTLGAVWNSPSAARFF